MGRKSKPSFACIAGNSHIYHAIAVVFSRGGGLKLDPWALAEKEPSLIKEPQPNHALYRNRSSDHARTLWHCVETKKVMSMNWIHALDLADPLGWFFSFIPHRSVAGHCHHYAVQFLACKMRKWELRSWLSNRSWAIHSGQGPEKRFG